MNDVFLKSDELRVALNEHPELPMVVFCKWSCGTGMRVIVGEVFDSVDCPYCPDDFGTFTDRDDWKRKMKQYWKMMNGAQKRNCTSSAKDVVKYGSCVRPCGSLPLSSI